MVGHGPKFAEKDAQVHFPALFDTLSDRLQGALGDLRGRGKLDEEAISRAMAFASSRKYSTGTTLFTSPQRSASSAVIILPVRNMVLFPGLVVPLTIGRETSRAAAQEAVRLQKPIGILLQSKPDIDEPTPDDP